MTTENVGQAIVCGSRLPCSLAEFERRAVAIITEEMLKADADNALIDVLCDAVRLKREYSEYATKIGELAESK